MGAPITWRSIMGQSLADASRPLEAASRSFNAGFENIRDVLKSSEAVDAANSKQMVTNNTNEALNQIFALQNPDAFKAAQTEGLFQRLMGQGAQIDQTAVRNAIDGRETVLQDRTLKQNDFNSKIKEAADKPIVDGIMMSLYQGKPDEAISALVANPHLNGRGDIQKKIADYQQVLTERGRSDTRFKWDEQAQQWRVADEAQKSIMRPLEVQAKQAGIAASRASTAASVASTEASRWNLGQSQKTAAEAEAAAKMRVALQDNAYLEGIYKDNNAPDLMKLMVDNKIGDDNKERNAVIDRLTQLKDYTLTRTNPQTGQKETVKVPLPMGAVKAAILSSHDEWINSKDEGWANVVEKRLQKILRENDLSQERTARDYLQYSDLLNQQANIPQSGGGKRR